MNTKSKWQPPSIRAINIKLTAGGKKAKDHEDAPGKNGKQGKHYLQS
ncbi:hypothetical protein PQO03_13365 [Lentisphaera profundi]|uniref:Uncharacterized protein n=1 Tax=Lentisphaera profundi TaxID=1658616 RepID=A0ABY7VX72_9BACT|nr:hypothetical protein [Lentisphaera profundi]WDE98823.1 hypothetical protein PQO03_13365 [Lentisphaera profundi]